MSIHVLSLLLICLQIAGINCKFWARPDDVLAKVGDNVTFECAIRVSSSTSQGIRWIYTAERNFRRPSHIYVYGHMFPQWQTRHNVTASMDGLFTLTIAPVDSADFGFYTCMDLSDDSKVTAQLEYVKGEPKQNQSSGKNTGKGPITPPPGPHVDKVQHITIRSNQSVILPANATEKDIVTWLLSPTQDLTEYFTLYDNSGEIPRKDGCGGYQFEKNHSIFIRRAEPCHAGTYTLEISGIDSRSIILIVDDATKVIIASETSLVSGITIAYETALVSGVTIAYETSLVPDVPIPPPTGLSQTAIVVLIVIASIVIGVGLLAVVFVVKLCRNGKCKNTQSTRRIDNNEYQLQPAQNDSNDISTESTVSTESTESTDDKI